MTDTIPQGRLRSFFVFVSEQRADLCKGAAVVELLAYCGEEEIVDPQDLALLLPAQQPCDAARHLLGESASVDAVELLVAASQFAGRGLQTWGQLQSRRMQRKSDSNTCTSAAALLPDPLRGDTIGRASPSLVSIAAAKARLAKVLTPKPSESLPRKVNIKALSLRG